MEYKTMNWTMREIRDAAAAAGIHWFEPGSMRFFGTELSRTIYQGKGGIFFITSEKPPHGARRFSVRRFHPDDSSISTVGEFCVLTYAAAVTLAKHSSRGVADWQKEKIS